MSTRRQRNSGFTLIELLVVVSILALLLALLLPSFRRAREQSRQVVCRKNIKDIWHGILGYSFEYNDRVPFMERIDPDIDPFDPAYPTLIGNVLGPYVNPNTFVCPSAVAGFPETDPRNKRTWKMTYTFSTADLNDKIAEPYDDATGAFTGAYPDPAYVNDFHFDGRPLRMVSIERNSLIPQTTDRNTPEVITWTTSVPLIADKLGENYTGAIEDGRPRYPHRGVLRRPVDVSRSLAASVDPRLVTGWRPGYFQLHADGEHEELFLTRYSPDTDVSDDGTNSRRRNPDIRQWP